MKPVQYTGKLEAIVSAYNARSDAEKSGSYWEHADVKEVRSHIKKHYIKAQGFRCCFCQQHVASSNGRLWDAEHIISRSKAPGFMFDPLNLVVSCPDCNIHKTNTRTTKGNAKKKYPKDSEYYRVIHPHFDIYKEHILHKHYIYIGKTPKGSETIRICNLVRYSSEFIDWDSEEDVEEIERYLDEIVAKKKTKKLAKLLAEIAKG